MDNDNLQPKISLPEALIAGSLFFVLPDIVELLLLFIGLDDFGMSDAFAFPSSQIYLRLKGVNGTYSLIANIIELIPYVGALPLRTIGFLAVLYVDRHPKVKKLVERAESITSKKPQNRAANIKSAHPSQLPQSGTSYQHTGAGGRAQLALYRTQAEQSRQNSIGSNPHKEEADSIPEKQPKSDQVSVDDNNNKIDLRR